MESDYQGLWSQCELQKTEAQNYLKQIEALVDSSPAGILLLDQRGVILRANHEFSRMVAREDQALEQWTAQQLIDHLSSSLGPPAAAAALRRVLLGEENQTEICFTEPAPKSVLAQHAAVLDSSGQPLGAVVLLQDISEIAHMRQELEDLAQLPQANPFPVVRLGIDGQLVYANPACQAFLDQVGLHGDVRPLLPSHFRSLLRQVLQTRQTITDLVVEFKGRVLQLTLRPFSSRDEVFLMIVDISEKQRAERLLRERAEQLKTAYARLAGSQAQLVQSAKMALLGNVAAGMAHEINTPVGAIGSSIDTIALLARRISEQALRWAPAAERDRLLGQFQSLQEVAGTIAVAGDRIAKIVRSLKSFVRLDEAPVKSVDLHEGLESTLTLLHNRLKQRIEVVREYHPLPLVECVPSQINQVFMNLLVNAVEAIDGPGTIWIKTESSGSAVKTTIRDSGKGIAPEKLNELFEPTFTDQGGRVGAGLGLSISQKIVHDHGGEIQVQSNLGQGSRFTVILPLRYAGPSA